MGVFRLVSFSWGNATVGDDLRFHLARYRAGGPWTTRRMVHDIRKRFGVSFKTAGGWVFFGIMALENQRVENEPDAAPQSPSPGD